LRFTPVNHDVDASPVLGRHAAGEAIEMLLAVGALSEPGEGADGPTAGVLGKGGSEQGTISSKTAETRRFHTRTVGRR
jgi:hypothetical protein